MADGSGGGGGGEVDLLFDVKHAFYIGNYQQCVSEAQRVSASAIAARNSVLRLRRDFYLYRAYIALRQYGVVRDEVDALAAPPALRPVRTLADYLQRRQQQHTSGSGGDSSRHTAQLLVDGDPLLAALEQQQLQLPQLLQQVEDEEVALLAQRTTGICAAIVWLHENRPERALRALHSCSATTTTTTATAASTTSSTADYVDLECMALTLVAQLALNRPDLAQKQLLQLQARDDDACVTHLAQASLYMALGGDKLQEAFYIYQELIDKASATTVLLNGQAVCCIGMARYAEAHQLLQSALDRDPDCPETLVNLIALGQQSDQQQQQQQQELSARYLSQLRHQHARHPYVWQLADAEKQLDRLIEQYAAMATV